MKRILLTGGSGFVGRNLRESLGEKYEIFAPSHRELDAADYESLAAYCDKHGISAVIHGAVHVARFNGAEGLLLKDMLMNTAMEKLSHSVDSLVYFGSGAEFDKSADITDVTEEDFGKRIPVSDYGVAKYVMNLFARSSRNITNLRLFGIFGKYELWDCKFLSTLCCKAIFDMPLTVRRECMFDFMDVADLTLPVTAALEGKLSRRDYNTCSGKSYPLTFLAQTVREISGKDLPVTVLAEGRNFDYTASNAALKKELPMWELTDIRVSIENLYRYYYDNKDMIDADVLRDIK